MNASAFRDLWARAVLKVFKIARAVGECNLKNFQNITSDHKSRNARAVHAIFCLLYSQQNHSVTLLCTVLETLFNGFQNARMFRLNCNYNNSYRQT